MDTARFSAFEVYVFQDRNDQTRIRVSGPNGAARPILLLGHEALALVSLLVQIKRRAEMQA